MAFILMLLAVVIGSVLFIGALSLIMWNHGGKEMLRDMAGGFEFLWDAYPETVFDERGLHKPYWYILYRHKWFDWIRAGCRFFTSTDKALTHWRAKKLLFEKDNHGNLKDFYDCGSEYRRACKFVELLEKDLQDKAR